MNLVIGVEGACCCRYFRLHPPFIGRHCGAIATDVLRYPGDGFVLQNTNYYTPILSLPFLSLVVAALVTLSQRTYRQHPRKGNLSTLSAQSVSSLRAHPTKLIMSSRTP